jgi:hypothetical protein
VALFFTIFLLDVRTVPMCGIFVYIRYIFFNKISRYWTIW